MLFERKHDYAAALADMHRARNLDAYQPEYGERIRCLLRQQDLQRLQQFASVRQRKR